MKTVKLKLGTHMDSGLMYDVYQIQGQGPITLGVTSLDRFYNFSMNDSLVTLFSRTVQVTKLKLGTHMDSGLLYCVYKNQLITLGVKSHDGFNNFP